MHQFDDEKSNPFYACLSVEIEGNRSDYKSQIRNGFWYAGARFKHGNGTFLDKSKPRKSAL